MIKYKGRKFIFIENTVNEEVTIQTLFEYRQERNIISVSYSDGEMIQGILSAI